MIAFNMEDLEGKSLAERIKISSSHWNPLKKSDILGHFDFNTCIVVLDSLSLPALKGLKLSDLISEEKIDLQAYDKLSRVFPLAAHEYTHFVDATSTVWGLNHLRMMGKAYNCNSDDVKKSPQCVSILIIASA